jgi:hypothetical protein
MDFDLNMVPNLDSGMQQTASAAAAPEAHVSMPIPVYAVPAV